jgi:very-short-patch-repair endonuclease
MDAVELKCLRIAARQHGVLSRRQVVENGMSSDRLESRARARVWQRLFPGVFRVEGTPATWRQKLKAASLWAGEGHALSHATAAALHGFDWFHGTDAVELTTVKNLRAPGALTHQVKMLHPRDVASVECFRVTSVPRTLLDLAATLPPPEVKRLTDEAMRRKWVNVDRFEQLLERHGGSPGAKLLRELTREYAGGDGPTESELEARIRDLLEQAGLPRPHKQHVIRSGRGVRRIDFHFTGTPVVIEADGYAWHASVESFERDRQRSNELTLKGFLLLQWTWSALKSRPEELLIELCTLLGQYTVAKRAA